VEGNELAAPVTSFITITVVRKVPIAESTDYGVR
jgi:hypothetical protein